MSKYDKSFKDEAVRLALTSTQSIAQTARDLGIKEGSLYNWINRAKETSPPDMIGSVNLNEEVIRLRKENARLKEEREILKKFATFFAKETK
jgi:transposase